jgi:hypothetical protein
MTRLVASKPVRRPLLGAAIGAVAVVVLLSGCAERSADAGGDPAAGDEVASVAGAGTPGAEGDAKGQDGEAPRRRLDMTEAETLAMFQPYLQCLKDRGAPVENAPKQLKGGRGEAPSGDMSGMLYYPSVDSAEYPAAEKACVGIRPLMPRELDPKANPEYMDDFRAEIECLEAHGVKVTGAPDGSGWTYRDGYQPDDAAHKTERDCQLEAFGDQG